MVDCDTPQDEAPCGGESLQPFWIYLQEFTFARIYFCKVTFARFYLVRIYFCKVTFSRYGFATPENVNDHELNCGGFGKQQDNNGKPGRDQTNQLKLNNSNGEGWR